MPPAAIKFLKPTDRIIAALSGGRRCRIIGYQRYVLPPVNRYIAGHHSHTILHRSMRCRSNGCLKNLTPSASAPGRFRHSQGRCSLASFSSTRGSECLSFRQHRWHHLFTPSVIPETRLTAMGNEQTIGKDCLRTIPPQSPVVELNGLVMFDTIKMIALQRGAL